MPVPLESPSAASATCLASSRVGVSTSARGVPVAPPSRCNSGSMKAAVFPVPVWARPPASLPDRALGRISAWMGVQYS